MMGLKCGGGANSMRFPKVTFLVSTIKGSITRQTSSARSIGNRNRPAQCFPSVCNGAKATTETSLCTKRHE